ncbi:MAG: hypothetical protein NWR72_04080 [Bacteroidia bacterium]|nr:hypothetical protein [Bacteroidia bacterium]
MKRIIFALLPLLLVGAACSNEPVFPVEPKIEFLDIQPRVVKHLQDSIVITFRFQDGDGDLGAIEDSEDFNLILIDSRINNGLTELQATNKFTLLNLTPDTRNPSIQGTMSVKLDFTANLPGQLSEQVRYQIKLFDRAGNLATPINENSDNSIFTDYITIER